MPLPGSKAPKLLRWKQQTRHTIFVESQNESGQFGVPTAVFLDVLDAGEAETLSGTDEADRLVGEDGEDAIDRLAGDDSLAGGLGEDLLLGDNGNDLLRGGKGEDLLTGDKGADIFALAFGEGKDTVWDFEIGEDLIGLAGTLTFNQISIGQSGNNAVIEVGKQVLAELRGIDSSSLSASAFVNVSPTA